MFGGEQGGVSMTVRDKLIIYIYRKMNDLENEKETVRHQVRFQPMDSLDMYEVMRSDIRINTWNEFMHELFEIVLNCK